MSRLEGILAKLSCQSLDLIEIIVTETISDEVSSACTRLSWVWVEPLLNFMKPWKGSSAWLTIAISETIDADISDSFRYKWKRSRSSQMICRS